MIFSALFPTVVAEFMLNRSFTEEELTHARNQPVAKNKGNSISVNHNVLVDSNLESVRDFIDSSLERYVQEIYNPLHPVKLRITESWLNYTSTNEHHHPHAHPNSFISGVFYFQSDKDLDKIYFAPNKYNQLEIEAKEWNLFNSKTWWLSADAGKLILFPSSLPHYVDTVTSDTTRISLSFNTFPVGELGDTNKSTRLVL